MIKKITNIRFSDSEKLKRNKKAELDSRRNRLLMESDWTQLPDINLSSACRSTWAFWRNKLRSLSAETHSLPEYKDALDKFEIEKYDIPVVYSYDEDIEKSKSRLLAKIGEAYIKRTQLQFMPNLEIKFKEVMSLVEKFLFESGVTLPERSIPTLIRYFEGNEEVTVEDLTPYPFICAMKETYNTSLRHVILSILRQHRDYYKVALREENMMLHFRTRILGAPDTPKTIQDIEREIITYYGY